MPFKIRKIGRWYGKSTLGDNENPKNTEASKLKLMLLISIYKKIVLSFANVN